MLDVWFARSNEKFSKVLGDDFRPLLLDKVTRLPHILCKQLADWFGWFGAFCWPSDMKDNLTRRLVHRDDTERM